MNVSLASAQTLVSRGAEGGRALPEVFLTLNPSLPVKGRDVEATITIRVVDHQGLAVKDSAPPVLVANVGTVKDLRRIAAGTFEGRYLLPPTRHPEVAIVVAFSAWPHPQSIQGATGILRVPLASRIDLTGATEPNAMMSLTLGEVRYGPIQAHADGKFSVPVVVPPGTPVAEFTAVDRAGNRRTNVLDLHVPPTDPLACVVHPTALPLGRKAQARIVCAVSDSQGKPLLGTQVVLTAQQGTVVPQTTASGQSEWIYTPPSRATGAEDALEAHWEDRGRTIREPLTVGYREGPVQALSVSPLAPVIHQRSATTFLIELKNAQGGLHSNGMISVSPSVGTASVIPMGPGKFKAVWALGETQQTHATVSVRAKNPPGVLPAQLYAWSTEGSLWVGVTDLAGLPVAGQKIGVGSLTVETGPEGTARVPVFPQTQTSLEIWHQDWPSLRLSSPDNPMPSPPSWTQRLLIAPATPVNIRTQVRPREVTYWIESAEGEVLWPREVAISASDDATTRVLGVSAGRTTLNVASARASVSVSITDLQTGVTAVAQVAP